MEMGQYFTSMRPKPAIFHGRNHELSNILSTIKVSLDNGTGARISIRGTGGLGKTTLAHVIAKQAGYTVFEVNARFAILHLCLNSTYPSFQ